MRDLRVQHPGRDRCQRPRTTFGPEGMARVEIDKELITAGWAAKHTAGPADWASRAG